MNNDREATLNNFFKSLRITLNNCSIYFKEHPLFIKSIEKLQIDTRTVLGFVNPFIIGITPDSLFCGDKQWEKEALYVELAVFLHRRKLKKIEIKENVTAAELGTFVMKLALPVVDIIKEGGLACILEKEGISDILIEELDYSSLLREEGQEQKDVWAYLLKRAVKEDNKLEIKKLIENFDAVLEKTRVSDFLENENLREATIKFLNYLKEHDNDGFRRCAKSLIRKVSNSKEYDEKDKIKRSSFLVDNLTPEDITNILCEDAVLEEDFNVKSIELFSSLLDRSQNEKLAASVAKRMGREAGYNTAATKKIKELLASLEDSSVKTIYQYALGSFLKDAGLEGSLSFDHEQIKRNYRVMLLNLINEEQSPSGLLQIAEKVYPELDKVFEEGDMGFILNFIELVIKKINLGGMPRNAFEEIKAKADKCIEQALLEQKADAGSLIAYLSKTAFDKNYYLNKIFIEKNVNHNVFRLFFNFFPRSIDEFHEEMKTKSSDINFLRKTIESLKGSDSKIACSVLECIFFIANRFLKIEILKIMQGFSNYNEKFILSLLSSDDRLIKTQAAAIAAKNSFLRQKAADILLLIPNRLGIKNKLINENINIIGEFNLVEARPGLEKISQTKVFWKQSIKKSALNILNGWRNGKN